MFPIISSENEKRLDQLAYDIVMFFQDYDWYEYCDVVDDLAEMPVYEFQRVMTVAEEYDKLISYFWNNILLEDHPESNDQVYSSDIIFARLVNLYNDLYPERPHCIQPKFDEFKKHISSFVSTASTNLDLNNKFVLICTLVIENSDFSLDATLKDMLERFTSDELSTFESVINLFDQNKSADELSVLFNDSSLSKPELKFLWDKLHENYDRFSFRQFLNSRMMQRELDLHS